MPSVQSQASLAEATVTAMSRGEVAPMPRTRRKHCPPGSLPTVVDGSVRCVRVDEKIMTYLREQHIDFRYVEVRAATEVIVRNEPVR